jgi:hypothetical protein
MVKTIVVLEVVWSDAGLSLDDMRPTGAVKGVVWFSSAAEQTLLQLTGFW